MNTIAQITEWFFLGFSFLLLATAVVFYTGLFIRLVELIMFGEPLDNYAWKREDQ